MDGLDELNGEDAQCEIIQLVSTFAYEHHDAPLVWIIASRPESHISNAFEDDEVQRSCFSEYIPIDSTEACKDVERFLRSGFATVQKKFRHSIDSNWPSNNDFLKLAAAASGLFVYAEVAMQFIRDSDHADPVSRFEALLSVINNSNAVPTNENPFVHLDALYRENLSSIPSTQWPTTKRLLAFTIYGGETYFEYSVSETPHGFHSLRGMSIFYGVPKNVVYASLNKCRSVLKIPNWKVAHTQRLAFHHASLADHLRDSSRSGDFHVGQVEDVEEDMTLRLLELWSKCSGHGIALSSIKSTWRQYCSTLDDKSPSRVIKRFHEILFHYMTCQLCLLTCRTLQNPVESPIYSQLRKVHMRKLCHVFVSVDLLAFVNHLMPNRAEAPPIGSLVFHSHNLRSNDIEVLREVRLKDLKFGQLDWKEMSPAFAASGHRFAVKYDWMLRRPSSNAELKAFVSDLEALQKRSPELGVVIVGGVPKERVAAFCHPIGNESADFKDFMYYVVPYPE
ncbi:hypothetical protein AGABI2DRAFT_181402 [Agaricus bisporus var. bisporus H97]|uniref:hypothetical protein n=1 Tax=Agaricus bisporus var. bisporus (strain H97 / ATCC MYA-4626 / FGSC 10389) TaxID=936046 RepID=UPI00029F5437|nr:hypothetical protein AGABI2DRAFT_181402 [Agaricus bisporus var. bisporus H97]EKV42160.1 hypothetical protein AGABI2DRAFT_181402 [Agaricus bisporus var. bisporus H97]